MTCPCSRLQLPSGRSLAAQHTCACGGCMTLQHARWEQLLGLLPSYWCLGGAVLKLPMRLGCSTALKPLGAAVVRS